MAIKVGNYLAADTIVWLVSPLEQSVAVFVPHEPVKNFGIEDVLALETLLPGFELAVRDVFAE